MLIQSFKWVKCTNSTELLSLKVLILALIKLKSFLLSILLYNF